MEWNGNVPIGELFERVSSYGISAYVRPFSGFPYNDVGDN